MRIMQRFRFGKRNRRGHGSPGLHSQVAAEALETRCLLTNVVSVSIKDNSLAITGDNGNNHVRLRPSGSDELLWLWASTASQTTFTGDATGTNFVTDIPIDSITTLKVNLKGGDDLFEVWGADVLGKTNIVMGKGNDTVQLSFGSSPGIMNGPTTIKTGSGGDDVVMSDWTFKSQLRIATGSGNDDIKAQHSTAGVAFNGKLNANLGGGNDTAFFASSATFGGGGTLNGGSGLDILSGSFTPADWQNAGIRVKGFEVL